MKTKTSERLPISIVHISSFWATSFSLQPRRAPSMEGSTAFCLVLTSYLTHATLMNQSTLNYETTNHGLACILNEL